MLNFDDLKKILNENEPTKKNDLEQAKIEYIKAKTENEKRKSQPQKNNIDKSTSTTAIISIISIIFFMFLQLIIVILIIKN